MTTQLNAGDLALIGYSSDTGGKSFAFVLLTDVDAGTSINFTDDGWFSAGGFRSGEGEVTYTAPAAGASAGTVITFTGLTGAFNPSTSGDQIIAFQGPFTPASTANGGAGDVNLFALDFADGNSSFEADASSSNASAAPAGLTVGSTALAFTLDNGAYTGPTSGTKADLLTAIADAGNWTLNDSTPVTYASSFAIGAPNQDANVTIGDVSISEGDAGTKVTTFTVTRNNAAGDFTIDYATADGTATAGADYAAAQGQLHFTAGGPASQTISVTVNGDTVVEQNESFSVGLSNLVNTAGTATLTRSSATGTILNDDVAHVATYDIQGASHISPYLGQTVITQGVVTAIDTTGSKGYWIQDEHGDGNAATSDAVFVFTNGAANVHVGDLVQLQGVVNEYNGGVANNLTITEIDNPTNVTVLGTGHSVAATIIGPDGVLPPTEVIEGNGATFDPTHDAIDFYESLEGMVVTVEGAQAVTQTISGATWVVADHGLEATGMNDRGGITLSAGDFNPERIQVYADSGVDPGFTPNYVMGDQLGDVTGVISYFGGEYELVATQTPSAASQGALPKEVTSLHGDGANLTVGAYNLNNLDPNDPQTTKFDVLGHDIAVNLGGPDVLGVEEIQDSNGTGTGVLDATVTLQKLVDAIAAAGGPHYAWVAIDPTTENSTGGEANGNIRSAILYNPDRVQYVDGTARLVPDDTPTPSDAFHNSRQPLAADFMFHGEQVTVIDVHDYSRGGSDELFGANQPALNNGDDRRDDQTAALGDYVHQLEQANPSDHVAVVGDFNAYYFEQSLTQLTAGGDLANLVDTLPVNERYSYLFEGNSQQLDNLLVSQNLTAGALFDNVHLNTGQPSTPGVSASDHDAILSQLHLNLDPTAAADVAVVDEDGSVAIAVLDNDTDPNNDALSIVLGSAKSALGASIAVDHGHVVYSADADSFDLLAPGSSVHDSFTYRADDGFGGLSDAVTVTVTVSEAGDNVTLHGSNNGDVWTDVGGGRDTTYDGGNGADRLSGGDGSDHLLGGNGDDVLDGGDGIDFLDGGNGQDLLVGGAGSDTLNGGNGDDQLNGGAGDDVLTAGTGNDTMIGGAGHDTFILGVGSDLVADFNPGEDVIKPFAGEQQGALHLSFHDVDLNGDHVAESVVVLGANAGQLTLQGWTLESLVAHDYLNAAHQVVGDWLI